MKAIRLILILGLMTLLSSCSAPVDQALISSYLPTNNKTTGIVYYLGADKETEEIANRFQQARLTNPEWFKSYLGKLNLQPGELLPYHQNFEITKEEYEKFIAGMKDFKLVKLGDVSLNFHQTDKALSISIEGLKLPINQVTIDLKKNSAKTPFSALTSVTDINQDSADALTGRWTGIQWKHVKGNAFTDGYSEKFAIGVMIDSKEGVLYYDLKSPNDKVETHFFVKYDLK